MSKDIFTLSTTEMGHTITFVHNIRTGKSWLLFDGVSSLAEPKVIGFVLNHFPHKLWPEYAKDITIAYYQNQDVLF